jgi:cytochrome c oxidase subunit 3
MNVAIVNQKRNKIHPQKFALWAACASILMMFAAMTSAYIVRKAAGNWLEFRLPEMFFYSTGLILLSSLTLHASYQAFVRGNEHRYKALMLATFGLGLGFVATQYLGWLALNDIGVMLDGNPSGSFIFVISGLHAAHVLGGIAALVVALLHAFMLPYKATERRKHRFQLVLTYWHFVDFLWLYLFGFFILQMG